LIVFDRRSAADEAIASVSEPPGKTFVVVVEASPARLVCGFTLRFSDGVFSIAGASLSLLKSPSAPEVGCTIITRHGSWSMMCLMAARISVVKPVCADLRISNSLTPLSIAIRSSGSMM
jgi:hypothetical protein